MEWIHDFLQSHAEPEYAVFSASLMQDPTVRVLGVRLPLLRRLAREIVKKNLWREFWEEDSEGVFELILLKGLAMAGARMSDGERWQYVERYVGLLTNWSLCDSVCTSLHFVRREPEESWKRLAPYWQSDEEFRQRFGVVMLLDHYILPEYADRVLEALVRVRPAGYYAGMAVAWALSVCFVPYPEKVHELLQGDALLPEVRAMTLRKIVESRRVSPSWKERIRSLRR